METAHLSPEGTAVLLATAWIIMHSKSAAFRKLEKAAMRRAFRIAWALLLSGWSALPRPPSGGLRATEEEKRLIAALGPECRGPGTGRHADRKAEAEHVGDRMRRALGRILDGQETDRCRRQRTGVAGRQGQAPHRHPGRQHGRVGTARGAHSVGRRRGRSEVGTWFLVRN